MAELLEQEAAEETKKAMKKKKKKKKTPKQKAPAPSVGLAEEFELPGLVEELSGLVSEVEEMREVRQPTTAMKPANEEADEALLAALGRDDDLDAIVAAINAHVDYATPELLNEASARAMRDSIKKQWKKALRQEKLETEQEKTAAERQA